MVPPMGLLGCGGRAGQRGEMGSGWLFLTSEKAADSRWGGEDLDPAVEFLDPPFGSRLSHHEREATTKHLRQGNERGDVRGWAWGGVNNPLAHRLQLEVLVRRRTFFDPQLAPLVENSAL